MEPISLTFYAAVCGVLSVVAPNLGGMVSRLAVGAGVGLIAASVLPIIKGMMTVAY